MICFTYLLFNSNYSPSGAFHQRFQAHCNTAEQFSGIADKLLRRFLYLYNVLHAAEKKKSTLVIHAEFGGD